MGMDKVILAYDCLLMCPKCSGQNLHQVWVKSIFRDEEDKDGTAVISTTKVTVQKRIKCEQIPGRRDVIDIKFFCDGCGGEFILRILQHKGNTMISWKEVKK